MPIAIRLESRDVTKASRGCAHEGFFACGGAPGVFGAAAHGRTDARSLDAPGVLGVLGMLGATGAIGAARRRF
ncbi:transcriptional regulator [Burkholderia pseudomallei]|uniref:Transcriptional regulator n=3 Tax=Burkholderia pseudomallei TaxID=28450 RepID=A0AAX0UDU5_BURPE|nr:transcriptional regulatory protein [Burkholderia pseudomallei 1106a]AFR17248.1 transcriptional regulatory protein [Burkholderia pseudomallei BPC006]AUL57748.1 transcriptional regulator [Burkholderia pseudomallei]EES25575.1 transcriptional regulatory protein [Burkholderia pseudomallei 1106b]KYZ83588.1 transcriptional regulator [Burkholderia pseudomallei]